MFSARNGGPARSFTTGRAFVRKDGSFSYRGCCRFAPSPEEFLCGTVPRYGNKFVSCGKFSRRMEFEGTVYKVLPVVKGTSQRGEWMKQEVVFELPGEFNRKICVGFWGDKAHDAGTLREGDKIGRASCRERV